MIAKPRLARVPKVVLNKRCRNQGDAMRTETWLEDCRRWCGQIKYVGESLDWAEKPSHSGWLEASCLLLDERRVTIPHLYFKGEYQTGRMGDRVTYSLMYKEGKEKRRVFMLEAWPPHVRSHRFKDGTLIFGSHIISATTAWKRLRKKSERRYQQPRSTVGLSDSLGTLESSQAEATSPLHLSAIFLGNHHVHHRM